MVRILFDAHHLGMRQTGNETWSRNIIIPHLGRHLPANSVAYALTRDAQMVLRQLTDAPTASYRTVALGVWRWELPWVVRRLRPDAVFAQYTMPPTPVPSVLLVHDLSFEEDAATDWLVVCL